MSENILSLEDLKFLEKLHSNYGLQFLRVDDSGIRINNDEIILDDISHADNFNLLSEISKKLKYRLNSNFQMNFSSGFHFDVVRDKNDQIQISYIKNAFSDFEKAFLIQYSKFRIQYYSTVFAAKQWLPVLHSF